jgi:hypothetical protein
MPKASFSISISGWCYRVEGGSAWARLWYTRPACIAFAAAAAHVMFGQIAAPAAAG